MAWWDWSDPSFTLAFLAALAGVGAAVLAVVVPRQIHNASQQGERIAQQTQRQLLEMQEMQLELVRRGRWEHLLEVLPTIAQPAVFYAMRRETGHYRGDDRELLESAVRANPLQPFPFQLVSQREAQDYIKSLPDRAIAGTYMFPEDARRFAKTCVESFAVEEFGRLRLAEGLVTCFPPGRTPGHQFYRDVVNHTSWRMAEDFLYSARHLEQGGHAANVITGVLLATKDIHAGWVRDEEEDLHDWLTMVHSGEAMSPRGWPADERDRAMFNSQLKQAMATLLSNDLGTWGSWPDQGLTDSPGAAVAWIIRAAGEVALGDEHLEMKIMQHLPTMVNSLSGHPRRWGTDVDDVRHGLGLLKRRCPGLWAEFGPSLVDSTGVAAPS